MAQASDGLSPLQLSGQLNSLPCSLTFRQEETISIIRLIEQVGAGQVEGAGMGVPRGVGKRDTRSIWAPRGRFPSKGGFPRRFHLPPPFPSRSIWGIWLLAEICQL